MTIFHDGYDIESFEAGRGLWHARIRRADRQPVVIDGCPFPLVEIGFAWFDEDAAITDARQHIDRCKHRWSVPDAARAAPATVASR
ncbi:MAG: hypothetical protein JOY90_22065 [Bradyrhizobium sp.]|uniref:hypothetical protein n=1 Tax=Bradyrhizobium sp. TaxID=376 RepID=UPI001DB4D5F3|nr:hypothetical protein [Bradyrhizobium sp.]MBV9563104.1 hypothetical protein [Bradyrhizobium sp.]